jgi:hypothetical protein
MSDVAGDIIVTWPVLAIVGTVFAAAILFARQLAAGGLHAEVAVMLISE